MVQKGHIRNEWVNAYIASGDLSEVPEHYIAEVKERAAKRKPVAKEAKKPSFEPAADASKSAEKPNVELVK